MFSNRINDFNILFVCIMIKQIELTVSLEVYYERKSL